MKIREAPERNIRTVSLAVLVLLIFASGLAGQRFLVRTYEEQDGLIGSAVNDIAQDAEGRMWFSARNGISVYDGARWAAFNAASDLPTLTVHQLRADGQGKIWAIGENPSWKLLWFSRGKWESVPLPKSKDAAYLVTGLSVAAETGNVRVAVGTSNAGVFVFDGSRWTEARNEGRPGGDRINGLAAYEDGFLAATDGGLFFIGKDGVENRWEKSAPRLREEILGLTVEKTAEGEKIWVAGSHWVAAVLGTKFDPLTDDSPVLFNRAFRTAVLLPSFQGGVFIGNALGLFYFTKPGGPIYPLGITEGLIAEGTTSLFRDREKNLWIGGLRGVSRISSFRFFNFRKENGLLEDEVTAIQHLGDGVIAFGHNDGLSFRKGEKFELVPFSRRTGVPGNDTRVLDMATDKEGGLWIAASARGLGRWTPADGLRWVAFPTDADGIVTSVVVDQAGRVWFSADGRLFQIRNGRPVRVFPDTFEFVFIRKLVAGPDGALFVASGSLGVFRWDGTAWSKSGGESESGASNVYSVLVDSRGRTLVGTFAGLFELSGGRLVRFSENGFEIRRPVYLIMEDKPGRLWFGTDNGVIRWDGKTRRAFSKAEGLAGREVNRAAGMVDPRGPVWIGTNAGVSCFLEEYDLSAETVPPPLISITGLDVNGAAVDFAKEITLGYRENNLVFRFLGTSFVDENALRFQSRLDGFDQDWSPEYAAVDRQIRYTNLRPGTYMFNLRASNAYGSLSEPVSSPVIRIRNPFWLQWWFIAAGLLVGGGLILSLGLAVTQHRQAERLEALVQDRTAQIQATLNEKEVLLKEVHHRVKNNLQIISSLLFLQSRKIKDPATLGLFQGSISRIRAMALVHESLYRSDRLTSIGMEEYLRQLVDHLNETYALRKESIKIEVQAKGISLPLETAITYGLIVNELISNALKHAFPGDRSGLIRVLLAKYAPEEDTGEARTRKIVLIVRDDGIGIPPDMEGGKADSLGLRLVQNLVSQLEGSIEIHRDGGTIFRIAFPE